MPNTFQVDRFELLGYCSESVTDGFT